MEPLETKAETTSWNEIAQSWDAVATAVREFFSTRDFKIQKPIVEGAPELFFGRIDDVFNSIRCPDKDPAKAREQTQLLRVFLARTRLSYAAGLMADKSDADADVAESIIAALEEALTVFREEDDALAVATALRFLGGRFLVRTRGTVIDNTRRAIDCWQRACALPPEANPLGITDLKLSLGDAYVILWENTGDEGPNEAIAAYEGALRELSQKRQPTEWAEAKIKLARALRWKGERDRAVDVSPALSAFKEASNIYKRKTHPKQWASVQLDIGDLFLESESDLPESKSDEGGRHDQAIAAYERALDVLKPKSDRSQWLRAKIGCANAYARRMSGDLRRGREKALSLVNEALSVLTKEKDFDHWLNAKTALGIIYLDRIIGRPADNLERAIEIFKEIKAEKALKSNRRAWARAMLNLGLAYARRVHGDPAENQELALESLEASMAVWSTLGDEAGLARTRSIQGEVLASRLRGPGKENFEHAIAAYRDALAAPVAPGGLELHRRISLGLGLLRSVSGGYSRNPGADFAEGVKELEQALSRTRPARRASKLGRREAYSWHRLSQERRLGKIAYRLSGCALHLFD